MAPRARGKTFWLASPATGGPLQVVPAPTVNVRNAANTANITDTIYAADDPDATILAQGFLGNADGLIQFFTAEPQRVWLRCSKTGFTTQDIPLDVNFASNRYVPRGAWLVGTTYKFMDVVSNGGASWVALRTNTGVTPVEGADWTLVASGATLADAAPPAIAAAAAIGTSTDAAREDHTHSGSAYQALSDKGAANGYAALDANTRVPIAQRGILTGTVVWDPGSIAAGSATFETVTVTGAAMGDIAIGSHSASDAGRTRILVTAYVSAPDTVIVQIYNASAAAFDMPSGTLRAVVLKL